LPYCALFLSLKAAAGELRVTNILRAIAGLSLVLVLGAGFRPAIALAAKVDCAKVMDELNAGKKPRAVAQDLKISTSSVYRCRSRARAAAKVRPAAAASASASPRATH